MDVYRDAQLQTLFAAFGDLHDGVIHRVAIAHDAVHRTVVTVDLEASRPEQGGSLTWFRLLVRLTGADFIRWTTDNTDNFVIYSAVSFPHGDRIVVDFDRLDTDDRSYEAVRTSSFAVVCRTAVVEVTPWTER